MAESKFETGEFVMTCGVSDKCSDDGFMQWAMGCLERHKQGDWGDLLSDDMKLNDRGLESGDGRLHSAYKHPDNTALQIWIVTEWNRSVTTILLPEEY